jgi:hypothetical protein
MIELAANLLAMGPKGLTLNELWNELWNEPFDYERADPAPTSR